MSQVLNSGGKIERKRKHKCFISVNYRILLILINCILTNFCNACRHSIKYSKTMRLGLIFGNILSKRIVETIYTAKTYLFKGSNRYTRKRRVICSEFSISSILLTLNIFHTFFVFLLLPLNRLMFARKLSLTFCTLSQ